MRLPLGGGDSTLQIEHLVANDSEGGQLASPMRATKAGQGSSFSLPGGFEEPFQVVDGRIVGHAIPWCSAVTAEARGTQLARRRGEGQTGCTVDILARFGVSSLLRVIPQRSRERLHVRLACAPIAAVALTVLGACGADTEPRGEAGWEAIRNPVLGLPEAAIKDAFFVRHAGVWHLGYSQIRDDPFRFRLGFSFTVDWRVFEHGPTIDQPVTGGLASPNVTRAPDGQFVMTYNSHTSDADGAESKLYFRTSTDLSSWSAPTRIHVEGADAPEDRLIDAALAFTDAGTFLFFKLEQRAQVAHSPSGSFEGPWELVGELAPANLENYQVIRIDGRWHLLATTLPLLHRPVLHRLDGDEKDPSAWRTWTVVREMDVPEQSWNTGSPLTYERANAASLADERSTDGFFYLLYAGSTETITFEGRGRSSLGLARSRDLVKWEVPRER